jgi:hypothetical protein
MQQREQCDSSKLESRIKNRESRRFIVAFNGLSRTCQRTLERLLRHHNFWPNAERALSLLCVRFAVLEIDLELPCSRSFEQNRTRSLRVIFDHWRRVCHVLV